MGIEGVILVVVKLTYEAKTIGSWWIKSSRLPLEDKRRESSPAHVPIGISSRQFLICYISGISELAGGSNTEQTEKGRTAKVMLT
jgi:hypothetical protein